MIIKRNEQFELLASLAPYRDQQSLVFSQFLAKTGGAQ